MKDARKLRLALVVGAALATGCAMQGENPMSSSLAGTAWVAEEIAGQPVPESPRSTLAFEMEGDELRAAGSGGCNRYFGPVLIDGETIAFGALAATRRACEGPVMDQEQRFFAALSEAARFELAADGVLVLHGEDGVARARLVESTP
jgi:heat shock protein HslJ